MQAMIGTITVFRTCIFCIPFVTYLRSSPPKATSWPKHATSIHNSAGEILSFSAENAYHFKQDMSAQGALLF